jgi:acetyltransferase-like isoleucine patch superfamily enzyme
MFKNEKRNNDLRNDILTRFISNVMTDDERAKLFGLPEGCRIREGAKIISPENFKCGKYVWIGENVILDASGGLEIGDHTTISSSTFIWTHSSYLANLAMENYINSRLIIRKPTKIGSGCYIGCNSVIYHGTTIGNKSFVYPMTLINGKNYPDYSVIAGCPANLVDTYSEEEIKSEIEKVLKENA